MALWQYQFHIIPKKNFEVLFGDAYFEEFNDELFDDEPYWKLSQFKKEKFSSIQKFLPRNKSWSNEIELYGNTDSNCLEVYFDRYNHVSSVSFRLDFQTDYQKILDELILLCIQNELLILDEKRNVVPYDLKIINQIINSSDQVKIYQKLLN